MSVSVEGSNWRDVEVGRVVLFQGDHLYTGRLAAIVEIVDHKRILVDGPTTDPELAVPRQLAATSDCLLTSFVIENLPRAARTGVVRIAWEKAEISAKWEETTLAKKMHQSEKRKALSDFDRFRVMRLKKQQRFEVRKALAKVQATA